MSALTIQGADVRINEVNLSASLVQNSNAVAAAVVVSSQGPTGPTFYTSFNQFMASFGPPNSSVSFDHYAVRDYFAEGNGLWATRCTHSDATYGVLAVGADTGAGDANVTITSTLADPTNYPFAANFTGTQVGFYAFYPVQGQGSYSSNLSLSIQSQFLPKPTQTTKSAGTTGGILAASTYYYAVAAINASGQIMAACSTFQQATTTSTSTVTFAWNAVAGAQGYAIFGRAVGATTYLTTVGAGTLTWTDTGTLTAQATPAPVFTYYDVAYVPYFTLNVYNTTVSTVTPVESWNCSVIDEVDEMGQAMETAQRINAFSSYINVASNVPTLLTIPNLSSMAMTALPAGASGSAPTVSDLNASWNLFLDKQKYVIDVMINAGRAYPSIQSTMDSVANNRFDCVALLDVPSTAQTTAQMAVDYRNITLNLNSSYSALFTPDLFESDPINGKLLYVPPSGAMAALFARTTQIAQPWFSMAGLNRGITTALDVRVSYQPQDTTQMAQAQVNYMRKFLGRGIPLWEQWTQASQPSALQFLNVRMLCNIIKRTMYSFLLYSLQEPGDDILYKQITYGLEEYLQYVQGARGIRSFQVFCDATTNTPLFVNTGICVVQVYIVPTLAIRQINLTLEVGQSGLQITEQDIANFSAGV